MAGLILSNRNGISRDPFTLARELFAFEPFAKPTFNQNGFAPTFNVVEAEDGYLIEADLPGVKESDLTITLENRVLEIRGSRQAAEKKETESYHLLERRYGSFARTFKLPDKAASDGVTAKLADGVLTVKVPKRPEVAPRTIAIKTE